MTRRAGLSDFSERSLRELLDAVAARTPAPGGGSATATAAALAAALVEMAANFTSHADAASARAGQLRRRALELAEIELHAYEPVLEAVRLPRDDPERAARISAASRRASQSPLEVASVAAEVADLGAEIARNGNQNLSGDATAGALLAEAAAHAAANLVQINLTQGDEVDRAAEAASRARAARERALG